MNQFQERAVQSSNYCLDSNHVIFSEGKMGFQCHMLTFIVFRAIQTFKGFFFHSNRQKMCLNHSLQLDQLWILCSDITTTTWNDVDDIFPSELTKFIDIHVYLLQRAIFHSMCLWKVFNRQYALCMCCVVTRPIKPVAMESATTKRLTIYIP